MNKPEPPPAADTVSPPRNFTLSIEDRLRAYAQGAPGYIRRRKRIDDLEERLRAKVTAAPDPKALLAREDFVAELALLNDLIGRHNSYYPIEANLPVDVRTGRLLERGMPWHPLPPITPDDLLSRRVRSV